jgi:hypothetical protein
MRRAPYHDVFRSILDHAGLPGVDPRHAEAWARSEWGTLDHLSRPQLARFVNEIRGVLADQPAVSEALALSYGL